MGRMTDLTLTSSPVPDVSVRVARPADAIALGAVTVASWTGPYAASLPPRLLAALSPEEVAQQWDRTLRSVEGPAYAVLVALESDAVVGYVVLSPADEPDRDAASVGEVADLVVDPRRTRSGHGSRLLAAAVERMREQGLEELVVWCGAHDDARRAFLESAGLEPDGASRTLDDGEGTTWREVRLSAALGSA
jgi:GNAT superfamily N-acetyltransferase